MRARERFSGDPLAERQVKDALDRMRSGSPQHFFVTGPRRIGKTSLLNLVEAQAPTHGLVAVPFPLSDATLDGTQVFFEAMLEVATSRLATAFPVEDEPPVVEVGSTPAQLLSLDYRRGVCSLIRLWAWSPVAVAMDLGGDRPGPL